MLNEWIYFPLEESLGFPDSSVGKESACPRFDSWVGKIRWRRDRLSTPVFMGFPGGSAGKESTWDAGDLGSIPGLGRSPGEGKGYALQYSAWRIPWTIQSMGLQKVRYSWATFTWRVSKFSTVSYVTNSSVSGLQLPWKQKPYLSNFTWTENIH